MKICSKRVNVGGGCTGTFTTSFRGGSVSKISLFAHSSFRTHFFAYLLCFLIAMALSPYAAIGSSDNNSDDLADLSIEELMKIEIATVQGASRFEQKVTEAPASVSIVTSNEIKKYGYRTLADVLRGVRGFYVTNDRNYSFIGVRGFNRPGDYSTRILLLVDGHRINDNIYDSAASGLDFPVDVDLIDRIEIIRGPSSSLYGANAFFAVVNIFTRERENIQGVEVSGSAASRDTYAGRLSYGNSFRGGLEALISGSIFTSAGNRTLFFPEFADPATNNGFAQNADHEKAYSVLSRLSLHDITLEGVYSSREKQIPTASFGSVFNDPRTRTTDEHGYLDLKYAHLFEDDLSILARLFYDRYYYHGDYAFDLTDSGLPGTTAVNRDTALGEWWGGEVQLTRPFFERHKVTLGAEFRDNLTQNQKNYYDDPAVVQAIPAPILDDKRSSMIWALYLQDEFRILDRLTLNAGFRYDHYDTFGSTTNPRAALIYRPVDKMAFKLLYGGAFRAPNAFELYYNDGGASSKANPDLKPEKIRTYEFVYEQYLGEHLRSSVSGFYYRIYDLISQQVDPDGLSVFGNIDKVDASGTELELEGVWANGLQGRASYTYQYARDLMAGTQLTNSPSHLAKLNLVIPLWWEKLFAGTEVQYTSARKTLHNSSAGAFVITNLTIFSKNIVKGLELSATVYNLFDKKYGDPGAAAHVQEIIPQDGRTVRVKLSYNF